MSLMPAEFQNFHKIIFDGSFKHSTPLEIFRNHQTNFHNHKAAMTKFLPFPLKGIASGYAD
jgi:hypothetical protein